MKCSEFSAIILINVATNLQFSLLAPILPFEIKRRGVSQNFTGIIMGCLSAGYFICPCCVTYTLIPKFGRPKTVLIGFMVMSAALLLSGITYFAPLTEGFTL